MFAPFPIVDFWLIFSIIIEDGQINSTLKINLRAKKNMCLYLGQKRRVRAPWLGDFFNNSLFVSIMKYGKIPQIYFSKHLFLILTFIQKKQPIKISIGQ